MAVFGIGIDLVKVDRIRAAMEKHPARFRDRIFTEAESAFCETLPDKYPSYAGRFAAKEAFSKALGTGLRGAVGWRDIQVNDTEKSRPTLTVTGRAATFLGSRKTHVSITHLPDYAAAVVIIED